MKPILFVLLSLLLLSCGNKKKDLDAGYSSIYDELIMEYVSLDSLSDLSGVNKEVLVNMRYDVIAQDSNVTERIKEILIACRENNQSKLKDIRKDKSEYKGSNLRKRNITPQEYNEVTAKRNSKFGQMVPLIISDYISTEVDEYIENKYSLLSALPNTWNYYTKSEDKFSKDFFSDLNTNNLGVKCEGFYINRLNAYKDALCEEHEILLGKVSIPDFTIIPGDNELEIDEKIKALVIERTKSQIRELSSDIFWDVIVAIIVGFVFSLIIDGKIDSARDKAVKNFLKSVRWRKDDGFFKNACRVGLHALGAYGEFEEQVSSIRARYNTWKWIVNIIIFIISLIIAWFCFIVPQMRTESLINDELTSKIINSSNTLNINPERVINRYLNIE